MKDERQNLPSASGLFRIYSCPGSPALEAQAPESEPDDVTQEGQDIHAALEDPEFVELDEKAASIAEHLKQLETQAIVDWQKNIGIAGYDFKPIREVRLWIVDDSGKRIASAKPDVFVISRPAGEAIVLDFKSGYLPVTEARRSIQARIQSIALNDEYGPFQRIRAVMASYRFRGSLTVCDYTQGDLKRAKEELRFKLWLSSDPYAPRIPSIDACRYCRGKSLCREAAAHSLLPVTLMSGQKHVFAHHRDQEVIAKVAELSPQDLAYLHSKKALAEKVFDAVDQRLRSLPVEELNKVGLDLGKPGSQRVIEDIQKAWATLYNSGLMSEEEFRQCCKVTIGKIEEILVPKVRARDKETSDAAAKRTVGKMLDSVVTHKPKAAPLVAYKPKEIEQ